jgi:hypothetical protein
MQTLRWGRPRKQLSIILSEVQELGYKRPSDSEIVEICWLILSLSEDELKRIESSDEFPMIMKIIASRLLSSRWFETVEKILDRIYGKTILKRTLGEDKIINIVIQDHAELTEEQEMKIVNEYLRKKNLQVMTQ